MWCSKKRTNFLTSGRRAKQHPRNGFFVHEGFIEAFPTTPDPNTSANASRYKWEAYTICWQEEAYFCKSIAIEMGGASQDFSKVLGSDGSIWFSWGNVVCVKRSSREWNSSIFGRSGKCSHVPLEVQRPLCFQTHKNKNGARGMQGVRARYNAVWS